MRCRCERASRGGQLLELVPGHPEQLGGVGDGDPAGGGERVPHRGQAGPGPCRRHTARTDSVPVRVGELPGRVRAAHGHRSTPGQ